MIKTCKICGKQFETNNRRKICCSNECSKKNARIITKLWNDRFHRDYQRKRNKGTVLCRICGEPVFRDIHKRSTATMHDDCVFEQCADILLSGNKLTKAQMQRLYSRGYTIKEFKEDYM